MQKNSTHLITKECNGTQQSSVKPRKSTIEFLKQFARAYTYQQQMPYQLADSLPIKTANSETWHNASST